MPGIAWIITTLVIENMFIFFLLKITILGIDAQKSGLYCKREEKRGVQARMAESNMTK